MTTKFTKVTVTNKNDIVTVKFVGYDYKEIAWVMVQLMDKATHRECWANTPAIIVAVDSDFETVSFKDIDPLTIMAFIREFVDFDETVETMAENGIACQWEMTNW